jgi:hypothetical protein
MMLYNSQTCIKRSPFGQRKGGLSRQVTYYFFYDWTKRRLLFNTGDCLIEVTTWADLIVLI